MEFLFCCVSYLTSAREVLPPHKTNSPQKKFEALEYLSFSPYSVSSNIYGLYIQVYIRNPYNAGEV